MIEQCSESAIIYGAGGHARELKFQLEDIGITVLAFVDDFQFNRRVEGVDVLTRQDAVELHPSARWHFGLGNIKARAAIFRSVKNAGIPIGSFVSPRAFVARTAVISTPAQIFANSVISSGAHLEENVIVNFGAIVSHDVTVGRDSYVAPGARIAGHVRIGHGVWIGVGATIKNGSPDRPLLVGDNAMIGAGACVIGDVEHDTVVMGVPAKEKKRS